MTEEMIPIVLYLTVVFAPWLFSVVDDPILVQFCQPRQPGPRTT
jgi:hypothetical protein